MKYKIGDKVKIRSDLKVGKTYGTRVVPEMEKFLGKEVEITDMDNFGFYNIDNTWFYWSDKMFEDIEPKNKFKIGQRVKIKRTGKNAKILDITNNDYLGNGSSYRCYKVAYEVENNKSDWGVFTVHDLEEVKEILDEKEREYLGAVIRPFKKHLDYIEKIDYESEACIRITITRKKEKYTRTESIILPFFEKKSMYKNMENDRKYTLEELGL